MVCFEIHGHVEIVVGSVKDLESSHRRSFSERGGFLAGFPREMTFERTLAERSESEDSGGIASVRSVVEALTLQHCLPISRAKDDV